MNQQETREIVNRIYGHYNDRLPSTETLAKQIISNWEQMLKDITPEAAKQAITEIALTETYMPKPAQLRIIALTIQQKIVHPPEPHEAWAKIQGLSKTVSNGTAAQTEIHPVLKQTINDMGGINSIGTTTNGDRTFFLEAYEKNVKHWTKQTFTPK